MKPSLYEILVAAGVKIDHHESDLYAEATPVSKRIIEEYQRDRAKNLYYTLFTDAIDGAQWYDVPFMYAPWYDDKNRAE